MEIVALGMETRQLDFLDPVCHEAGAYRPLSAFA
jgi:hypothetical protein